MNKTRILGILLLTLGILIMNYFDHKKYHLLAGILCGAGLIWSITGKIQFKRNAK